MVDDDMTLDASWLDSEAGPAAPIGEDELARRVRTAMATVPAGRLASRRAPSRLVWLAAAACLVGASAFAMVRASRHPPAAPSTVAVIPSAPVFTEPSPPAPPLPPQPALGATVPPPPAPRVDLRPSRGVDVGALLERANRLRGERRWRDAEATYQRVVDLMPGSPEAQAARVAAAQLRLDQLSDAPGAERLFQEAERHGGALREEASWGVVEARRGRAGELRAIQDYLEQFPSGAMAPSARARMRDLGASAIP
jgi:hypothetical protein